MSETPSSPNDSTAPRSEEPNRSALTFCGLCGALNPSTNHFCAACGTTLLDAFHASEGLRVFERADAASRLIEIVPSGRELDIVEDTNAPSDYVRIRLQSGRLGYIRLHDVAALADRGVIADTAQADAPDINYRARGCITPTAALGALLLMVVTSILALVLVSRSDSANEDILAIAFCIGVVPLMFLTIGLYLFSRDREDRLHDERDEQQQDAGPA